MQLNHYYFKSFDIIPDANGVLFYTPELSAHIHHLSLINFLKEIRNNNILEIDELNLKKLLDKHDIGDSSTLDYLVKDLKLMAVSNPQQFKKLFVLADEFEIEKTIKQHFKSGFGLEIYSGLDEELIDEKSLIIAIYKYYQPKLFKEIYSFSDKQKAWVITAYVANNYLIIDNIYHPRKGMPCHFCNINRHHNIVNSTNQLRQTSWVNFCRRLISQELLHLPAMQLTNVERGLVTFWLVKTIKNFVGHFSPRLLINEVTKYSWINLVSGEINQEQAVHWPFCVCLQG